MQLGDINYLAVLNAQQSYQQALISVVQAKAARYADTVALFQAARRRLVEQVRCRAGTTTIDRRRFPVNLKVRQTLLVAADEVIE